MRNVSAKKGFFWFLLVTGFLAATLTYGRTAIDFSMYWKSSRLLIEGMNPYAIPSDPSNPAGPSIRNYNLPHTLTPVIPLALLPFETAQFLWFMLLGVSLLLPFILLPNSSSARPLSCRTLVGLSFFPAYAGLYYGQLSQLLVGALAIFFWRTLVRNKCITNDFAAGLALSIATLKPHAVYLLLIYLVIQSAKRGQTETLVGLFAGCAVLFGVPVILRPNIFESWQQVVIDGGAINWIHSTIAANLKLYSGLYGSTLLSVLPTIIAGLATAIWAYGTSNQSRDRIVLPILVAASAITAPYAWIHDFGAILPGLLFLFGIAPASFQVTVLFANLCGILPLYLRLDQNVFVFYPLILLASIWGYARRFGSGGIDAVSSNARRS